MRIVNIINYFFVGRKAMEFSMKKYLLLIISVINTAITALYLALMPSGNIPMHYGINGSVDRYGSKWELMLFPCILLVISIAFLIYSFFTKNDVNESKNKKYINRMICGLYTVFFILLWTFTLAATKGIENIGAFVPSLILILMGALMIFIGNMYGKIKQNSTFGIKIRATLKSERVWKKTHRLGGYLAVVTGIIWIVCGIVAFFMSTPSLWLLFPCLIAMFIFMVIIPTIYAEVLYHKEKQNNF